jgi:hypothetical protein
LSYRAASFIAGLGILIGVPAQAQSRSQVLSQADSAFAAGDLRLADSLYYIVVRFRPRDPIGRAALGEYLGAQGKAKVAVVLLEEARMFGGDPAAIARQLVPYYEELGDWRALLTLPASPMTATERRRAAWLSENPFSVANEGGAASMIGTPAGDTIARVAVRVGSHSAVASIVGGDVGFMVGSRLAANAHHFGNDSATVAFDSIGVGQTKFVNVPAGIGATASSLTVGVAALGRMVVQIDYARNRIVMMRADTGPAEARFPLARFNGQVNVLDRGRWVPLGEFAGGVAKSRKTLVVDYAAGEARIKR